jgi:sterol desaturase/sphingolipid hydroxylase (fatty acid hydroxylase superfamily)
VVALQPFIEWTTHVFVLHARPRRVLGRELDLYVAKKHRRHHEDPRNLEILSMPVPGLITIASVTTGIAALLGSWADRLTLGVTVAVLVLVYEWIHFLIHTDYKPRTAAYRRLYQHHRLHHYRNENYWYGVSRRLGDQVLRTNPAKDDVPLSPTCKSLLG